MRKKTALQKENTNGKRGKAQNKHHTLKDEILEMVAPDSVLQSEREYPQSLLRPEKKLSKKMESARRYFDAYIDTFYNMSILYQPQDSIMVANLALFFVEFDEATKEVLIKGTILEEENGNTGLLQTKMNPAVIVQVKLNREIKMLLKDLGQLPSARADILNKVASIQALDVVSNETAKAADQGPQLDRFIGKHKADLK